MFGIGYEGLTLDAFISRLRLRGVDTLVDVRLNAISRKRGFSKRALSEALSENGIGYIHLPALGNARENRSGYGEIASDEALAARERFRATLETDSARVAMEQLLEVAQSGRVAVFCFESDERHCHREQVLEQAERVLAKELASR